MKTFLLIMLVSIASTTTTYAQKAAKSVFFELGGPGLASVNYDMRFNKKEDGLGFRAGIGGFSLNDDYDKVTVLFFPVGLNYLIGKDGKNYFEVGGGATFVSVNYKNNQQSNDDGAFTNSFGHLNFGYRLQPANGGFLFRAAIVPIFTSEGFVPYYAGISFGYKF
ncbi:MAG TPA: hypothetical protein VF623_02700 [Segetibacter sp.]|jgi:hypothetical protein